MAPQIIAWLRELEQEFPFALTFCAHNSLEVRFEELIPKKSRQELAERIVEFCHDAEDASQVMPALSKSREFFFWWD